FSTLGWFNDPLLSTTLRLDTLDLASTVIHELTHNTLFVKGEVTFNESFASFVGARGAIEFFQSRGQPGAARRLDAEWRDEKLLGSFWGATLAAVDSAYTAHAGDSTARITARDSVFARMRRILVRDLAPRLSTADPARLQRIPLDNASLLARRVYAADLWLFDAVHERVGGGVARTVRLVRQLTKDGTGDPFDALRAWLAANPAPR
ncbi:MAG: aminopeptidase, partial [Gemmatimonadaceae bacterium]|nr:aminopeptidase [Gemmatimonadaceae bacterium]